MTSTTTMHARYLVTAEGDDYVAGFSALNLVCTDCRSDDDPTRFLAVRTDTHGVVSLPTLLGWAAAHDAACHLVEVVR